MKQVWAATVRRRGELALVAWSVLLALVVLGPVLGPGYVLSYDMVWVPEFSLHRADLWGLGDGLPRAVPSDALVALVGVVVPQAVVQKLVLGGTLVAVGLGAARLTTGSGRVPQAAAATIAVWNPFVAERLLLGHWPLLVGYAGVLWFLALGRSSPGLSSSGARILALAATAVSVTTALMGWVATLIGARRSTVVWGLAAVVLSLPWLVTGVVADSFGGDPRAIGAFAPQPEGAMPAWMSLLTLGGVWNEQVVPGSRALVTALVLSLAMFFGAAAGVTRVWLRDRAWAMRLCLLWAVGYGVAVLPLVAPEAFASLLESFPPAAVLRDSSRWVLLMLPAVVVGWSEIVAWGLRRASAFAVAVTIAALSMPLAALPDLAFGVSGRLRPVSYPDAWSTAHRLVATSTVPGDVLSLPFDAYRSPAWNGRRPVLDPAGKFFDRETVVNDALLVNDREIAGESRRAARIGTAVESADHARLAREGIGLVVVDVEAARGEEALTAVAGLRELTSSSASLRVFVVPGAEAVEEEPTLVLVAVVLAWTFSGAAVVGGLVATGRRGRETESAQTP